MTVHAPLSAEKERLQGLIQANLDARRYFYARADERWLDWLWQNGFLDPLKEEDSTLNGYRPPELDYLVRMAEQRPARVVDIMLEVPISTDTRSQQIAYSFNRICRSLPPKQLARMVEKIRSERWIPLLNEFDQSVFGYEEMLTTLSEAEEYPSMLVLTGAVLAVRSEDEMERAPRFPDNPFYFDHLSRTDVFRRLAGVGEEYAEDAFALATDVMAAVVLLGAQKSDSGREQLIDLDSLWEEIHSRQASTSVFAVTDRFALSNVDFFDLELGQGRPLSYQGNVRELAVAVRLLADRLIGEGSADQRNARKIHEDHVAKLPDSQVTWRLRLYVWSLRPEVFGMEFLKAFTRIFEVKRPYEIMKSREFQKALHRGFPVLSAEDQQVFVQRTIGMFSQLSVSEMDSGSRILSLINPFLSEDPGLVEQASAAGFRLDPEYDIQPATSEIGEVRKVIPQAPISQEEFSQLPIAEITRRLRREWAPDKLYAQNTSDSLYEPLNASGVGNLIKNDMPQRLQEYIYGARQFFDRDFLDPHYTYEYLAGIKKTINDHKEIAAEAKWDTVIDLLEIIRASGAESLFGRGNQKLDDFWHANWDAVHLAATDVLRDLFTEKDGPALILFGKYRERILEIIDYLLTHPQPSPEDEQVVTPQGVSDLKAMRNDADGRWATDPFSKAVNSVRGRAFETLVLFAESDGLHLRDDVKSVYECVIQKEKTRALMSMVGRFLPSFYFRDKDWMRKLLPQVFSQEPGKKYLSKTAWEGFLTNGLYSEMFRDPKIQDLYWRGLELTDDDYPQHQKHVTDPDKGIAEHLALAYMYCEEEFGLDHPLFRAFWETENIKQHAHFVNYLGQEFVFRSGAHGYFMNHPSGKQRLRAFWRWLLENHEEQETFREFGLWINLEKGIFLPDWLAPRVRMTLEKSKGVLESENDLRESSVRLAQEAPEDTLKIARLHLFEGGVRGGRQQTLMRWDLDKKWIEAFKVLYDNPATRVQTEALINQLVRDGRQAFWSLEQVVADNNS